MAVIKAGSSQFPFHITDVAALLRLNIRRRGPDFLYQFVVLHKSIHADLRSAEEFFNQHIISCRTVSRIFIRFFDLSGMLHHGNSAAS